MSKPANSDSGALQPESIGWIDGQWLPFDELALPLSDLGVRQAVTVVERLRTYHGKPFGQSRHLRRFEETAAGIGIPLLPSGPMWSEMIAELLDKNESLLKQDRDLGVTLLATPGTGMSLDQEPTTIMHVNRIDHGAMNKRQADGQPIVITDVVQPPAQSWPRHWKVRCRLHYFMADRAARKLHPDATGLLLDGDATITESSIANIAIVESGAIFSPPKSQVLGGITQSYIEQLADELNLRWTFEPLSPHRVSHADEVLLMGTDGGIWWGWELADTHPFHSAGPVFSRLRSAFDRLIAS